MKLITIRIVSEWGEHWWFRKNSIFSARRGKLRITEDGQTDFCHCAECSNRRKGKTLYPTYEIMGGEYDGSLVPIVCCEEV